MAHDDVRRQKGVTSCGGHSPGRRHTANDERYQALAGPSDAPLQVPHMAPFTRQHSKRMPERISLQKSPPSVFARLQLMATRRSKRDGLISSGTAHGLKRATRLVENVLQRRPLGGQTRRVLHTSCGRDRLAVMLPPIMRPKRQSVPWQFPHCQPTQYSSPCLQLKLLCYTMSFCIGD